MSSTDAMNPATRSEDFGLSRGTGVAPQLFDEQSRPSLDTQEHAEANDWDLLPDEKPYWATWGF